MFFTGYVFWYMGHQNPQLVQTVTCPTDQGQANCTVLDMVKPMDRQHTEGAFLHSYFNDHVEALEQVESTIKFSLAQL